jgi:hypothetical protein
MAGFVARCLFDFPHILAGARSPSALRCCLLVVPPGRRPHRRAGCRLSPADSDACGSAAVAIREYPDGSLRFIEPQTPFVRKLFRKIDTRARVAPLQRVIEGSYRDRWRSGKALADARCVQQPSVVASRGTFNTVICSHGRTARPKTGSALQCTPKPARPAPPRLASFFRITFPPPASPSYRSAWMSASTLGTLQRFSLLTSKNTVVSLRLAAAI